MLRAEPSATRMIEDIVGREWSLAVLDRELEAERPVASTHAG
jgi:hypothetical protein